MRKLFLFIVVMTSMSAHAGDPEVGKALATACTACHGPEGISSNPVWPNLAGQHAAYLAIALKAYRDGRRVDPLMSPMARRLSDQDIANLAAYFSSLPASP